MTDEFHSHGILGILYAEDFGIEAEPPLPDLEPAPPPLAAQDVEAACRDAVTAAEAAWAHSATARRTTALETLASGLAAARRDADAQAEALADGLARTTLAMVAGALPHLCRSHGDAEVTALLHQLLPALAARTRVVVRVHAALAALLEDDLVRMGDGIAEQVDLRPVNLAPGDVRLSWEGGTLHRDAAALCAAMADALARLGLFIPDPAPPQASTTHPPAPYTPAQHTPSAAPAILETRSLAHV